MPGLNNTALNIGANAIKAVLAYGQLHSAPAGSAGTSHVTTAARKPLTWTSVSGSGDFSLAAAVNFTGGAPNTRVHSLTIWSAISGGTCYGEFIIRPTDQTEAEFNSGGDYTIDSLDLDGSAS